MTEPTKGVILVVDDEPLKRVTLQIELSEAGYTVMETSDAASAMQMLRAEPVDVVITDLRMPGTDGLQFLKQIKTTSPATQVILMTAFGSIDLAIEAMKRGAYDFLTKPFKTELLLERLERLRTSSEWPNVQGVNPAVLRLGSLVGRSYAVRQLFDHVRSVADSDRPILIEGEAGAGAELVAEAVHSLSRRASGPLRRANCAALNAHALEADLFGNGQAGGQIQQARGGTLFLDEIDALPTDLQLKLLQVLEQGESAGVRVLCATHRDLHALVDSGRFRQDLYYRVSAVTLQVPPLRDRREDIPLLAEDYLKRQAANGQRSKPAPAQISAHAVDALMSYHWPGNLLEFEHTMERAITIATGDTINLKDIVLPKPIGQVEGEVGPEMTASLTSTIAGVERKLIDAALRRATGNQAKAAQFLGIPRTTLRDKMAKYGMVGNSVGRELAPPKP